MDYSSIKRAQRSTKRITITIPNHVFEAITTSSALQGRSFSNLASYLLERSLESLDLSKP